MNEKAVVFFRDVIHVESLHFTLYNRSIHLDLNQETKKLKFPSYLIALMNSEIHPCHSFNAHTKEEIENYTLTSRKISILKLCKFQ